MTLVFVCFRHFGIRIYFAFQCLKYPITYAFSRSDQLGVIRCVKRDCSAALDPRRFAAMLTAIAFKLQRRCCCKSALNASAAALVLNNSLISRVLYTVSGNLLLALV